MATLTVQTPARSANALSLAAAEELGDEWVNTGKEMLLVNHTDGAGADAALTVTTQMEVDDEAVADKEIAIAKGTMQLLGPFPAAIYNDDDQKVQIGYDDHTDLEVAVIRLS
jgi:hypothetical protein